LISYNQASNQEIESDLNPWILPAMQHRMMGHRLRVLQPLQPFPHTLRGSLRNGIGGSGVLKDGCGGALASLRACSRRPSETARVQLDALPLRRLFLMLAHPSKAGRLWGIATAPGHPLQITTKFQ
jgi:hypothetical protein